MPTYPDTADDDARDATRATWSLHGEAKTHGTYPLDLDWVTAWLQRLDQPSPHGASLRECRAGANTLRSVHLDQQQRERLASIVRGPGRDGIRLMALGLLRRHPWQYLRVLLELHVDATDSMPEATTAHLLDDLHRTSANADRQLPGAARDEILRLADALDDRRRREVRFRVGASDRD